MNILLLAIAPSVSLMFIYYLSFYCVTGNRLQNVVISVGPSLSKMKTFATFKGPGKSGARYVFKCKEVTTGRYVKVMIKGAEYLTLAEVQVFSPGMSEHSLLK